jgi:3-hydroxyisobutyrate dehydrogenase-like beta-hydroxyacid dehydrogenase
MTRVSVIGLGNMGATLARTLIGAGHTVTVWNRTATKAEAFAGHGATVAPTVAAALGASPVTVACVSRYEDIYSAFAAADAASSLSGRTLVNLSWGTPADAVAMEQFVQSHGGEYLDGGIPVYPSWIGLPETGLVYSGPVGVWDRHRAVLVAFGGASCHVGEAVEAANVLSLAIPGAFFHAALGAFLEAVAFAGASGVELDAVRSMVGSAMGMLGGAVDESIQRIAASEYQTDQASLWISLDAMRMSVAAMEALGQRATQSAAFLEVFELGIEAGLGDHAPAAIYELLRRGG